MNRLDDILKDILDKLPDAAWQQRLILRLDSGYGSDKRVEKLKAKTKFVTKCYSSARASKLAKEVQKTIGEWLKIVSIYMNYLRRMV